MYVIEVPFLSLEQIYKSGQVFRWIRFNDNKYVIPFKDKAVKVIQQRKRLAFDCSEETFYGLCFEYFDMQTDYVELNYKMQRLGSEIKPLANRGNGVRILKQDLYEMLITYAIGGKNYSQIKYNIDNLCIFCGKHHKQAMKEIGKINWYEFPSVDNILSRIEKLKGSVIFKNSNPNFDMLIKVCNAINSGLLQRLKVNDYSVTYEILCDIGYSSTTAKLIMLQGMHNLKPFAMTSKLELFMNKVGEISRQEFKDAIKQNGLMGYKGYVRQVLIYNMTNPPKGGWIDGTY